MRQWFFDGWWMERDDGPPRYLRVANDAGWSAVTETATGWFTYETWDSQHNQGYSGKSNRRTFQSVVNDPHAYLQVALALDALR